MTRLVLVFIAAPLGTSAVAIFCAFVIYGSWSPAGPIVFISLVYGCPLTIIFGVPLYFIFKKQSWLRFWQVVLGGSLGGAVFPLGISLLSWNSGADVLVTISPTVLYPLVLYGAILGAIFGSIFWLVAYYRVTS